jgi:hypothetical protein
MTIEPTSGPVGTTVHVRATGCLDQDGQNHAVSFNTDVSAGTDAKVRAVDATLNGETLSGAYTISAADASGQGPGLFFVQCADDLQQEPFTITP